MRSLSWEGFKQQVFRCEILREPSQDQLSDNILAILEDSALGNSLQSLFEGVVRDLWDGLDEEDAWIIQIEDIVTEELDRFDLELRIEKFKEARRNANEIH